VILLSHTGSTGYSGEVLRRARETGGPAVGISAAPLPICADSGWEASSGFPTSGKKLASCAEVTG
jgi:hypothetical protein